MNNSVSLYTKSEEIKNAGMKRPHVFILGAGASYSAFPNGDPNGKILPLMNNLIQEIGLDKILQKHNYNSGIENFEELYSDIFQKHPNSDLLLEVEDRISQYFRSLILPNEPTIYDYLVLSLRPKDVIATFNWDPFLYLALKRNFEFTKMPHYYFLHGCSILGYCDKDKKQGEIGASCSVCGKSFKPNRLLYPIKNKDYTSDNYIASQWKNLQSALQQAFTFTIFGYGAPKSDVAAIQLMKDAWGKKEERWLEESEFIDILDEDSLLERWDDFVHSHHYRISNNFFESFVARHPRRTCETYWEAHMEVKFYEENPVPKVKSLTELWQWFEELIKYES